MLVNQVDLVHEQVSFVIRKVSTKFCVIPSTFEYDKGIGCNLGKTEWIFPKNRFSADLGSHWKGLISPDIFSSWSVVV